MDIVPQEVFIVNLFLSDCESFEQNLLYSQSQGMFI
jgi:hypothetical protein